MTPKSLPGLPFCCKFVMRHDRRVSADVVVSTPSAGEVEPRGLPILTEYSGLSFRPISMEMTLDAGVWGPR